MKIEVTDATTLPTWQQPHVKDGFLDLASLPVPEDVTGLQSALSKERSNVSAYKKYGTPDEIEARIADLTEKAKGSGKGSEDAQAKLDAMKADYEGKLTGANDRMTKMVQRGAASDLKAELAKAGFIAESIDDIASSAMGRLKFTDDGTAQVMTSDGKPMIGSGADHGATLADLAKELAASKSYAVRDAGKGGGGKPAGSAGGTPDKPTVTWSQFEAMSQSDRMTFSKSGGAVKN
jgi:hypothetical protein